MRNDQAISFTRNRTSLQKGFHFLLYRLLSILQDIYFFYGIPRFASELIEYACINIYAFSDNYCTKMKNFTGLQ